MNLHELQMVLLKVEAQLDDISKTNVAIGDGRIVIYNTGDNQIEPAEFRFDGSQLVTIYEESLK